MFRYWIFTHFVWWIDSVFFKSVTVHLWNKLNFVVFASCAFWPRFFDCFRFHFELIFFFFFCSGNDRQKYSFSQSNAFDNGHRYKMVLFWTFSVRKIAKRQLQSDGNCGAMKLQMDTQTLIPQLWNGSRFVRFSSNLLLPHTHTHTHAQTHTCCNWHLNAKLLSLDNFLVTQFIAIDIYSFFSRFLRIASSSTALLLCRQHFNCFSFWLCFHFHLNSVWHAFWRTREILIFSRRKITRKTENETKRIHFHGKVVN